MDICNHDEERTDKLLDIYEKFRWEWTFKQDMKSKKPRKISRAECIRSAVHHARDDEQRR